MILTTGTTGEPKGVPPRLVADRAHARERAPEPGAAGCSPTTSTSSPARRSCARARQRRDARRARARAARDDVIETIARSGCHARQRDADVLAPARRSLDEPTAAGAARSSRSRWAARPPRASLIDAPARACSRRRASRTSTRGRSSARSSPCATARAGLPLSVLDRADGRRRPVPDRRRRARTCARASAMLGYHGAPDAEWRTRPATSSRCATAGMQFVGRTIEIINVGGAKVHPLPVEELVCAVQGVVLAAVYGRPNPITGQIVAVDVVAAPEPTGDASRRGSRAPARCCRQLAGRGGSALSTRSRFAANKLLRARTGANA